MNSGPIRLNPDTHMGSIFRNYYNTKSSIYIQITRVNTKHKQMRPTTHHTNSTLELSTNLYSKLYTILHVLLSLIPLNQIVLVVYGEYKETSWYYFLNSTVTYLISGD